MWFKNLREDIKAAKANDPAARNWLEVLLTYSGVHALSWHRVARFFYKIKLKLIARMISQTARFFTGVEIHPAAKIEGGVFIDHGMGVVIGETAIIGDNCLLYQGVTLGGTGKDKGKRHPTLGDNVLVGSGAKVLGPFRVGNNVKIAANAVVLNAIPDDCTAVGVPAHIVKRNGEKVSEKKVTQEIDQIHIPDPVSQELCRMQVEIERMKKKLAELEKD